MQTEEKADTKRRSWYEDEGRDWSDTAIITPIVVLVVVPRNTKECQVAIRG